MKATHYLRNYLYPEIIEVFSKTEDKLHKLINNKWVHIKKDDSLLSAAMCNNFHKSLRRIEKIEGTFFFSSVPLSDTPSYKKTIPKTILQSNCLEFKPITIRLSNLKTLVGGDYVEHHVGEQVLLYNAKAKEQGFKENLITKSFNLNIHGHAVYLPVKMYSYLRGFNKVT